MQGAKILPRATGKLKRASAVEPAGADVREVLYYVAWSGVCLSVQTWLKLLGAEFDG